MDEPLSLIDQRYDRQRTLIPTEKLAATPVTIIGVGAIGRQLTLQLAAMGVRQFQLIDFDHVDWPNVAAQGFATADIGHAKVHAVASSLFQFDPTLHVETVQDRWRPKHLVHAVVFSCVDSITARSAIWNGVGSSRSFWGDARMLGEVIRILTATDCQSREHYRSTLFDPSQAQLGSCTARSTIYTASIAAGLLAHQFACWLRGTDLSSDRICNLLDDDAEARNMTHRMS